MRWWISSFWLATGCLLAGPVEFGWQEFHRAVQERKLPQLMRVTGEVSANAQPESFEITPTRIAGGDVRGLMYGLLEAADQVRRTGKLSAVRKQAFVAGRGVRLYLRGADWERQWFSDRRSWEEYFQVLARARVNRLMLVFGDGAWQPPYPSMLFLPEWPRIEVAGLSSFDRLRNLSSLRMIGQTAIEYGLDLGIGIWRHRPGPRVSGWESESEIAYTRAALSRLLADCPGVRFVYFRSTEDSDPLLREAAIPAVMAAGRLVVLEVDEQAPYEGAASMVRVVQPIPRGRAWPDLNTVQPSPAPSVRSIGGGKWFDASAARIAARSTRIGRAWGVEYDATGVVESGWWAPAHMAWGQTAYDPETSLDSVVEEARALWGGPAEAVLHGIAAAGSVAEAAEPGMLGALRWSQERSAEWLAMDRAAKAIASTERWKSLASELDRRSKQAMIQARENWADELMRAFGAAPDESLLLSARQNYRGAARMAEMIQDPDAARIREKLAKAEAVALPTGGEFDWPVREKATVQHVPPSVAHAGEPLVLALAAKPAAVTRVRLHYRRVGPDEGFQEMEGNGRFAIPAGVLRAPGQLLYRFELVDRFGSWFLPEEGLPVFVMDVSAKPAAQ